MNYFYKIFNVCFIIVYVFKFIQVLNIYVMFEEVCYKLCMNFVVFSICMVVVYLF